jgi:hypothetical protein
MDAARHQPEPTTDAPISRGSPAAPRVHRPAAQWRAAGPSRRPVALRGSALTQLQATVGNATVARLLRPPGRILQRVTLTLPHAQRSVAEEQRFDTAVDADRARLTAWIDAAKHTNRVALGTLVATLRDQVNDPVAVELHAYASAALNAPRVPLVVQHGQQHAAHVSPGLLDAARVDYAKAKGYLQEGEGDLLARHWHVQAEVFDQPVSGEPFIRVVWRLGAGGSSGLLLFVNGDHYIVITPATKGDCHYRTADDRYFRRSARETVADGNCLIDGLFILAHQRNASRKELEAARRRLSQDMPDEALQTMLTAHINDVMHGETPVGLGPAVSEALGADPTLRGIRRRDRRAAGADRPPPSEGPVIGLAGVRYPGPSRFDAAVAKSDKTAIHRGEAEVEQIGGIWHVRLYTTVPSAAQFGSIDLTEGSGESVFKDVQQDIESGRIVVSSGQNRMLWVSGGRPLRAVKWAQKYKEDRENSVVQANKLAVKAIEQGAQLDPAQHADEREALFAQAMQANAAAFAVANYDAPLIRSYLVPLAWFNEVSKRAILETMVKSAGMSDKTFNVDRHAEPNQFGLAGKDLEQLGKVAVPGSLITYAYDLEYARGTETAGDVRPVGELWERLGVPQRAVRESPWVHDGGFRDRKQIGGIADDLNMHYVTWRQLRAGDTQPPEDPLLAASKTKLPWEARTRKLREFLASEYVEAHEVDQFMERVVAPWASQGAIEHLMAADYERINHDEDVLSAGQSTFGTNDFSAQRETAAKRAAAVEEAGRQIDRMVRDKRRPKQIIDALIAAVPELRARFGKITAKSEGYTLYEHAQMVLTQFRKLRTKGAPLFDEAMMTKLILLHDIEKTNSKAQYGKDPVGEHKLTVDEIRRYAGLWKSRGEVAATVAIVGGDPFGAYLKDKSTVTADDAFMAIITAARHAGVRFDDYVRFFHEFHRFYQADFSSYTTASTYRTEQGQARRGKGNFDLKFAWNDSETELLRHSSGRFLYTGEHERRYQALAAMFERTGVMAAHLLRLDPGLRPLAQAEKVEGDASASGGASASEDEDDLTGTMFSTD